MSSQMGHWTLMCRAIIKEQGPEGMETLKHYSQRCFSEGEKTCSRDDLVGSVHLYGENKMKKKA